MQNCTNSIADTQGLLQSCAKSSIRPLCILPKQDGQKKRVASDFRRSYDHIATHKIPILGNSSVLPNFAYGLQSIVASVIPPAHFNHVVYQTMLDAILIIGLIVLPISEWQHITSGRPAPFPVFVKIIASQPERLFYVTNTKEIWNFEQTSLKFLDEDNTCIKVIFPAEKFPVQRKVVILSIGSLINGRRSMLLERGNLK